MSEPMKIWSYVASFPDEFDALPDAIESLSKFSDKIYIMDGGFDGALCQRPRFTLPLAVSLFGQKEGEYNPNRVESEWNGVPLILTEIPFNNPGHARNQILNYMSNEPDQPTWITWIDSDEICSNEYIKDIRVYLSNLPADVSNVCPKWFTLIEDQQHYTPSHSSYLSHARIHHPGIAQWDEVWHEAMHYIGRRAEWDRYIIHTRFVLRKRLLVQRGHKVINEGAWANVSAVPVPDNVTWKMTWPDDEPIGVPFSEDIRNYLKD
jgi:hypothetical protein